MIVAIMCRTTTIWNNAYGGILVLALQQYHSHIIGHHPHTIGVTQQPQSHPQSPVRLDSIISHIHIPSPIQSHNT